MDFKTKEVAERFNGVCEELKFVAEDMEKWATERELPFVVTEAWTTVEEDKALNRVSSSHSDRRAIDLRSIGWDLVHICDFVTTFNFRYQHMAAISSKTGIPVLVVYHDNGHGPHFHIQLHKRYALA